MKRLLLFAGATLLIFTLWYYWKNPANLRVKIRDQVFFVDVAVTAEQQQRGLGGRSNLGQNRGMLFIYQEPGLYHFWMKNMRFPLDFIWIDDNRVVDLTTNVAHPATNEPPVEVWPKVAVDKVLEVNAGVINRFAITIGDRVEFFSR